jgi:uncharacterized membrane protein (DUF373 family)
MFREVFGRFCDLIGVELMRTVVTYLERHELHVRSFTVAMIVIARHAIDVTSNVEPMALIKGALILALTLGYYLFAGR